MGIAQQVPPIVLQPEERSLRNFDEPFLGIVPALESETNPLTVGALIRSMTTLLPVHSLHVHLDNCESWRT